MLRRVFCKLLLVAVAVFGFLAFSGVLFAQGRSEEAFERVKEVQERHTLKLMAKPGVVGTAIGLNDKGRHVILIFLEKPGVAGMPKELEGVPVKQKVSGKIYALKPPTNRPPKKPSGLTATALSTSEIYLDWKDNRDRDLSHYNVYRSNVPGGPYKPIALNEMMSEYLDDDNDGGLFAGTTYYYVVKAVDTDGNLSAYSDEASATTDPASGDIEPPSAPTGLYATPVSSIEINLTWDKNFEEDIDYYNVYRSGDDLGPYTQIGSSPKADVPAYSDTLLAPETTYYYKVTAVDTSANESAKSNWVSATTESEPADVTPPDAPSGLNATAISSNQINLSWTDNADNETEFRIERKITGLFSQIATVGANVISYSNTGLSPSTTYTYRVRAHNDFGDSAYSNEDSATTEPDTEPVVDRMGWCSRPVPIGVSTGHPAITAGTIGCRLRDISGNVFALSNNHVYADENMASIGDNVLQPGTFDDGVNPDDAIGTLTAFEPIKFYPFGLNTIDAAIAQCSVATLGKSTPEGGYGIPNSSTTGAEIGQAVQKYGRTTGLTKGTVTAVNGAFFVQYSAGFAIFMNQIVIEPGSFSDGGDSGSLVVTDNANCNPVGLLFAGSSTQTIINPIDAVLDAFSDVSIDGK